MTQRLGRADLHLHTLASDGTNGIVDILDWVEARTELDVIAITDHERIDAAIAARSITRDRGLRAEVIVGEEVTTLGGHLLALFIEERIKPLRSLRDTIAEVHAQGGLAIPAHPLVPYPLCAQGFMLRRLLADDERYRPDGLETFNPTALGRPRHAAVVAFADAFGLPKVGNSDAHALAAIGSGYTTFHGHHAEDLRRSIIEGTTHHHGSFHATADQLGTFAEQLKKYGRDARAVVDARLRNGSGRDLGYPPEHGPAGAASRGRADGPDGRPGGAADAR